MELWQISSLSILSFRQDEQLVEHFSLSPADFEIPESAARAEYEKFLLQHPGRSTLRKEDAEFRFLTFWDNLKRILFYNKIEQGSAIYKYVFYIK